MALIGKATSLPTPGSRPQAAPQAAQAAPARNAAPTFGAAQPRNVGGLFLKGKPDGTAATYTVRVNRIVQKWANPRAVEEGRPQPTADELATAKPAFKKQDAFVTEVEVVESNNELCPPGYVASVTFTDKYPESYFADIKGFLCACENAEPDQIQLEHWQASYQPDQPLAGYLVKVTVIEQPTKDGKGVFTKHYFAPSEKQHPEAAA